ncbi:isocitrate lyase/phosphoenolpyruvate mutase family protein [Sphingosinicella sp. LHD-64]|uniref:isocitrate lyase/PEP mutase family protein n=1 Tax=Sphingosinicella sp. LHD-64 TaxID=3072139 RepID=UPI00280FA5B7|nr:isocitrate lyase/phosphoenolpyruvate mutase family protein [Sphingosinicella sp. LHD-64]MDQ8756630.1 isocitrate lyase/phosphoenolpyruvate mutase family protein [Sphingosinicella sp. LHD-64]
MSHQMARAQTFRDLHRQSGTFIIPNPFDVGSARLLAASGFPALATSSAGYAFAQGCRDHDVGRDAVMAHVESIAAATDLPVTADLGNGFADAPDQLAEAIGRAARAGAVGASIEDATGRSDEPLYPLPLAVERIRAAAAAARSQPFPFMLTARADNLLVGRGDLDDVVRRLRAYQDAGADVLYAPGLTRLDEAAAVMSAVDLPVNVVIGLHKTEFGFSELSDLGVKRISLGSTLARVAYGALMWAAREMRQTGTFAFAGEAVPYDEISRMLGPSGERRAP